MGLQGEGHGFLRSLLYRNNEGYVVMVNFDQTKGLILFVFSCRKTDVAKLYLVIADDIKL